jgi:hypothetical protein
MPGTHAQNVILVALLLEQLAPASTVTDELGEAAADEPVLDEPVLDEPVLDGVDGVEELPPLLHAARPVIAAMAAIPPSASVGRLLPAVLVLSLFIGGRTPLFLYFSGVRALRGGRSKALREAALRDGRLDDGERPRRQGDGEGVAARGQR